MKRFIITVIVIVGIVLLSGGSIESASILGVTLPIGVWVLKTLVRSWGLFSIRSPHGVSLGELDRMTGKEFESWITTVLERDSFQIHDTPYAGDFGVDVLCVPPGSRKRIAIQAKRYKSRVGNAAVQQAIAGGQYYDCAASAVVTQSYYTKAARRQAIEADPPVLLIDRSRLGKMAGLLKQHV